MERRLATPSSLLTVLQVAGLAAGCCKASHLTCLGKVSITVLPWWWSGATGMPTIKNSETSACPTPFTTSWPSGRGGSATTPVSMKRCISQEATVTNQSPRVIEITINTKSGHYFSSSTIRWCLSWWLEEHVGTCSAQWSRPDANGRSDISNDGWSWRGKQLSKYSKSITIL